jgi:Transcription factor WhiB/AT hook motif
VSVLDDLESSVFALRPSLDWTAAACYRETGALTKLFFSLDVGDIGRAKAICERCPLKLDCLAEALARQEPCGVWGGELLVNGRIITHKRGRGRPRKADTSAAHLQVVS